MQQTKPQQDKPQQQGELRAVVWQNGKSTTVSLPETLREVLHDPQALIWLDIVGECGSQQALLHKQTPTERRLECCSCARRIPFFWD